MKVENFEVNHLFEGQVHEHPHFSVDIQGHEYKGMLNAGEISWYHPHPQQKFEDEHLDKIESQVHDLMSDYLES